MAMAIPTKGTQLLLLLFFAGLFGFVFSSAIATSFIFNGFSEEASSNISLSGIAQFVHTSSTSSSSSSYIRLTNTSTRFFGRALYTTPFRLSFPNSSSSSFSTTFVFSISPLYETFCGHGMAFVMAPSISSDGVFPSQYLGLLNSTNDGNSSNHLFAVEFDTVQDLEFGDIDDNHVGINLNSMISVNSSPAAYWSASRGSPSILQPISLKGGGSIQAWLDYDGINQTLNVTIAPVPLPKPGLPLLSVRLDLAEVLQQETFVGFSGSTGVISGTHRVLSWSFSAGGEAAGELDMSRLPWLEAPESEVPSRGLVAGVAAAAAAAVTAAALLLVYWRWRKRRRWSREREVVERWELEYGLHRYSYKELSEATKKFSESELLGVGGFGRVYRGVLEGKEVAVKRMSRESGQGEREFIAEMASMGRLRHRNLVELLGWSRKQGELLLVYEYMENGSLDRMLFGGGAAAGLLRFEQRRKIGIGIATAMAYLHEGWEKQILHRDIKASNVLLDSDMNAKLGDFGLSRLYEHGGNPHTTKVVGTLGYLAPEFARTGKATSATDVYSFGIVLLELITGRRPILPFCRQSSASSPAVRRFPVPGDDDNDEDRLALSDAVWSLRETGHILEAVDPRLQGLFDSSEMERMLTLGLLCSHPLPSFRPSMTQVVRILEHVEDMPPLPSFDYPYPIVGDVLPSSFSSPVLNSVDSITHVSAR